MFRRTVGVAVVAFTLVLPSSLASAGQSPVDRPVKACGDLVADVAVPDASTHVTSATVVPAAGADPEFCDVKGHVDPAVEFELKLPTSTFIGRYLQYGCGGLCGTFFPSPFPDCGRPRAGDFAVAVTNDGHVGKGPLPPLDGTWAADNEPAREDFLFRAPHVVSLAAKQIITSYYGSPPKHSYFSGCSNGGREGMILAQRYPADFDGIIAGAQAAYWDPLLLDQAWLYRSNTAADGSPILTADKLPALHNAVVAACDNAMSLDLSAFRQRGGKLVIWHGWADEEIPPAGTVDYYQRLVRHHGGPQQTQQWARLFMVPGMHHCQGGDGLTTVDPTRELVAWVESGKAPDKVVAQGVDSQGTVVRTRPVFPYPLRAKYTGTGDSNDAANFVPAPPLVSPANDIVNWAGTYLYAIPGPTAH